MVPFFQVFPQKISMRLSFPLSCYTSYPLIFVSRKNHVDPQYAITYTPLLHYRTRSKHLPQHPIFENPRRMFHPQ